MAKKNNNIVFYIIIGILFIFLMIAIFRPHNSNVISTTENSSCPELDYSSCPETDCSICPVKTETKTSYETITKYQCFDGSTMDSLANCPQPNLVEDTTTTEPTLTQINKTVTKSEFEFTIISVGFDETDRYIINFSVKNRTSESQYFQPNAIAIVDSKGNQYDVYNTFDYPVSTMSETILPRITKTGYWYFDEIPRNSGFGTFSFETGFMDKETYKFTIPLN